MVTYDRWLKMKPLNAGWVHLIILTARASRAAGRISDNFAYAKPVPVSEIAQRSLQRKLCRYPRVVYLCRLKSLEKQHKIG